MNKTLHVNGQEITLESLRQQAGEVHFTIGETQYHFRGRKLPDGCSLLEQEIEPGIWQPITVNITPSSRGEVRIELGATNALVTAQKNAAAPSHASAPLSPLAPMPGLVRKLFVKVGDHVIIGQPLAVMEAMKLQLTLNAGADAVVEKINVAEGDMITEGTELVQLKAKAAL